MFMQFDDQKKRREKYGSAFLELAYGKSDHKVNVKNVPLWQNDSLYVYLDDLDSFYNEYNRAFGISYEDLFGIKYFSTEETGKMIDMLNRDKPTDFQILVNWLNYARNNHGFYILGI